MKVLVVASWYPSQAVPSKGMFVREQVLAAHKAGAEVEVLALRYESGGLLSTTINQFQDPEGFKVHELHFRSAAWKFIHELPVVQKMLLSKAHQVVKEFGPDLIHSHVIHPAGIIADALARQAGIPHVLTDHWSLSTDYLAKSGMGRLSMKALAAYMPVSRFLAERNALYSPARVDVIPNVIDEATFHPGDYHRGEKEPVRLMSVANWNRTKRVVKQPELFIEGLETASRETGIPVMLTLIGDGNMIPELKAHAGSLSYPIVFAGTKPKPEVAAQLRECDVFLHASTIETFSVVVAESLLSGTPVVASKVGAIPELVNESLGILVENDQQSWTKGIKQMLIAVRDSKWDRDAISGAHCGRFTYEAIGSSLVELYSELIS